MRERDTAQPLFATGAVSPRNLQGNTCSRFWRILSLFLTTSPTSQQHCESAVSATGAVPPGNAQGNTQFSARRKAKPEIKLTPGKGAADLTVPITDLISAVVSTNKVRTACMLLHQIGTCCSIHFVTYLTYVPHKPLGGGQLGFQSRLIPTENTMNMELHDHSSLCLPLQLGRGCE